MLNFSSHIFYPKTACNSETNDKSNESSKIGHAISKVILLPSLAISIPARADIGWPWGVSSVPFGVPFRLQVLF